MHVLGQVRDSKKLNTSIPIFNLEVCTIFTYKYNFIALSLRYLPKLYVLILFLSYTYIISIPKYNSKHYLDHI